MEQNTFVFYFWHKMKPQWSWALFRPTIRNEMSWNLQIPTMCLSWLVSYMHGCSSNRLMRWSSLFSVQTSAISTITCWLAVETDAIPYVTATGDLTSWVAGNTAVTIIHSMRPLWSYFFHLNLLALESVTKMSQKLYMTALTSNCLLCDLYGLFYIVYHFLWVLRKSAWLL